MILAVNKVDNVQEKADLLPHLQFLASQKMNFLDIVPISAETGTNVDTIAAIVRSICRKRSITSRKIILPIAHSFMASESSVKTDAFPRR